MGFRWKSGTAGIADETGKEGCHGGIIGTTTYFQPWSQMGNKSRRAWMEMMRGKKWAGGCYEERGGTTGRAPHCSWGKMRGESGCWVSVWSLLTAFSLTQQAWCLSPKQQQKSFTSLAENHWFGVWNTGVTPVLGAAATLTHTEKSFYSITDFQSHSHHVCYAAVYTMNTSFNILAKSVYLWVTQSQTDKPFPSTLMRFPICILTLSAFHTHVEQFLVWFSSFCCHSTVTSHPSFVNSSPQKQNAISDQNLQSQLLQTLVKLYLSDVF